MHVLWKGDGTGGKLAEMSSLIAMAAIIYFLIQKLCTLSGFRQMGFGYQHHSFLHDLGQVT